MHSGCDRPMYLVGILLIFLGALLVNQITGYKFRKSFFIIELPEYKAPSLKRAVLSMLSRGKAYIIEAGTIILVCNTVVQIMQSFNWQFQVVEGRNGKHVHYASVASPFAVLLIPLGFGVWQLAAAAITRIYRQGKCGGHPCGSLWTDKFHRHR